MKATRSQTVTTFLSAERNTHYFCNIDMLGAFCQSFTLASFTLGSLQRLLAFLRLLGCERIRNVILEDV